MFSQLTESSLKNKRLQLSLPHCHKLVRWWWQQHEAPCWALIGLLSLLVCGWRHRLRIVISLWLSPYRICQPSKIPLVVCVNECACTCTCTSAHCGVIDQSLLALIIIPAFWTCAPTLKSLSSTPFSPQVRSVQGLFWTESSSQVTSWWWWFKTEVLLPVVPQAPPSSLSWTTMIMTLLSLTASLAKTSSYR